MKYVISSPLSKVSKVVEDKLTAEKTARSMSLVFDIKFSVKEYKDVWAVSFGK